MSSYVDVELRLLVATRADWLCEYCLVAEEHTYYGCQIDHIISEKHGGPTDADNLAYACAVCNRAKGSDIGSMAKPGVFCRFFHPRTDRWGEHFVLSGVRIESRSEIGEVTARILAFNTTDRLLERQALLLRKRYPTPAAFLRMAR